MTGTAGAGVSIGSVGLSPVTVAGSGSVGAVAEISESFAGTAGAGSSSFFSSAGVVASRRRKTESKKLFRLVGLGASFGVSGSAEVGSAVLIGSAADGVSVSLAMGAGLSSSTGMAGASTTRAADDC